MNKLTLADGTTLTFTGDHNLFVQVAAGGEEQAEFNVGLDELGKFFGAVLDHLTKGRLLPSGCGLAESRLDVPLFPRVGAAEDVAQMVELLKEVATDDRCTHHGDHARRMLALAALGFRGFESSSVDTELEWCRTTDMPEALDAYAPEGYSFEERGGQYGFWGEACSCGIARSKWEQSMHNASCNRPDAGDDQAPLPDECNEDCQTHAADCDGYCDHVSDGENRHVNACEGRIAYLGERQIG